MKQLRVLTCAVGLALMAAMSFAGGYRLKYIATGWDIGRATPEQILKMMPKFEQTAFDGVAIQCSAPQDGALLDAGYIFNDPAWRYESFEKLVETYRVINSRGKLKENFISAGLSARNTERNLAKHGGRVRLDDDAAWARIAHNYGMLAKIAKAGGFRGIQLDNEDYHGLHQFEFRPGDGDYEAAAEKMRQRGREVCGAIFREFPDVRLGFFWAFSSVRRQVQAPDPLKAIRESNRLFPQFLNGLLDVMPPEAVVIDFDEDAYTFRGADGTFEKTFVHMMKHALVAVAPENRAKYRAQFRNSFLLYLDQYVGSKYRVRAGKRGQPNNWYRAPVNGSRAGAFYADLEAAANAADGYLGIYGERFGFVDWEHELDAAMKPWNALLSRITWDEELGLDAKLRLVRDPHAFMLEELAAAKKDPARRNLLETLPNFGYARPGTFIVHEEVTNRNYFAVTFESKGETAAVARWQNGLAWNWEPGGVRHVAFTKEGVSGDGWSLYTALLRVPVAATRLQLQIGTNEVRNAAMYRLDPPPTRPFVLAYQLDISRGKVPTLPNLKRIVDTIASLGYTQFQLYMECAFAYKGYEAAWKDRSPMTPDEMRELSTYCRSKGMDLVPSQNTFAHMGPWFEVADLRKRLAECPDGANIEAPKFKKKRGPVTLVASGGESLKFLSDLFDQLLPCAESRYVNIGCDEVYDLWDKNCRSAAKVAKDGYARTYFDHVLAVRKLAYQRQRQSMFWADAIFEYPELIREIPKDMIALVYGYTAGGGDKFDEKCAALAADEVRFYVCPGTSGWCGPSGRTKNMLGNVKEACEAGRRHGAEGLMVCDWGDGGHHQPWIVALPSLVYAAGLVQGKDLTRAEIAAKVDAICGVAVGAALIRYGDVYETTPHLRYLYHCYSTPQSEKIGPESLAVVREAKSLAELEKAPTWVKEDFATIDFLYGLIEAHAQGKVPDAKSLEEDYRTLWLKQNRPGGFENSLRFLKEKPHETQRR